jgi:hypothetical protein
VTAAAAPLAATPSPSRSGAIAWFFARIFFATGVPFAVMTALIWGWTLVPCAAAGAFFGLGMALALGLMCLWMDPKGWKRGFRVRESRVVEVDGDRGDVLRRVEAAIAGLPGTRSMSIDESAGTVTASIGWSILSFGERVVANVEVGAGRPRVRVESRPRVVTTVADYGKNARNVDAIVAGLGRAT